MISLYELVKQMNYRIRWNIGGSIIWRNAMEKHIGEINIGDLDEMQ